MGNMKNNLFSSGIHFEFIKYITCEICIHVCPINLSIIDWKLETD